MIEALVRARKERSVTQVELGRRIGWTQNLISEIETRERRLDILEFYALARALDIEPHNLFETISVGLPKRIAW